MITLGCHWGAFVWLAGVWVLSYVVDVGIDS